jgi:5-methylcytosine-specific restriction enzyme subunit McrC
MPPLTAVEYQSIPVGGDSAALSRADVDRLLTLAESRPGFCIQGHRVVKLAQYVGLVRLNDRILEILPKIGECNDVAKSRGTLLRLLAMVHDLPLKTSETVAHALRKQTLLDVFIAAFLRDVATLVRGGLVRRYRAEAEDLRLIRGRLDIHRQASTLAMRVDRLACRYDDLTYDNPWNQLLKAGMTVARPWIRQLDTYRHWGELMASFAEVSNPRSALFHSLKPDRQVQHYAAATTWARWILRLLSPNLRAGTAEAPELLFDMNSLFEKAVTAKLRRGARSVGLHLSSQERGRYLANRVGNEETRHFGMRPDLVLYDGHRVVCVADTKWVGVPVASNGRMKPSDGHMYQLNAYATVYPGAELALIYPYAESDADATATTYRLWSSGADGQLLHILRVDVATDGLPLMGPHHQPSIAAALV